MKRSLFTFLLIFRSVIANSQNEEFTTSVIFGNKFYHTISVGISFGPEHSGGLPKVAYSLQSGKNQGFYGQFHFATALGYTLSPGVEIGYRYGNIGAGYSFSFLGIDNNSAYYKWSHNINAQFVIGSIMAKIGTPMYYVKKGKDFDAFFEDFIKFKQTPLNLEILYHHFLRKE